MAIHWAPLLTELGLHSPVGKKMMELMQRKEGDPPASNVTAALAQLKLDEDTLLEAIEWYESLTFPQRTELHRMSVNDLKNVFEHQRFTRIQLIRTLRPSLPQLGYEIWEDAKERFTAGNLPAVQQARDDAMSWSQTRRQERQKRKSRPSGITVAWGWLRGVFRRSN